jgi:hypothetical protein
LPDAAEAHDVEPPGRFTSALTELDEDVHDQPVAIGDDAAAERYSVALLDDDACGAWLDLRSAEVDRARAIGCAGYEVEVAKDVTGLDDVLDTSQQLPDVLRRWRWLCTNARSYRQKKCSDDDREMAAVQQ